jgi:hypothetical protein
MWGRVQDFLIFNKFSGNTDSAGLGTHFEKALYTRGNWRTEIKLPKITELQRADTNSSNLVPQSEFFFFCSSAGDWTRGLVLVLSCLSNISSPFVLVCFSDRISLLCLGLLAVPPPHPLVAWVAPLQHTRVWILYRGTICTFTLKNKGSDRYSYTWVDEGFTVLSNQTHQTALYEKRCVLFLKLRTMVMRPQLIFMK